MSKSEAKITAAQVCDMLVVLLNEADGSISPQTAFKDLAGWDSMGVLLLMAELDEKFDMPLKEEQIKSLKSVEDLIGLISDHGNLTD